jgi:RIO kinase 1
MPTVPPGPRRRAGSGSAGAANPNAAGSGSFSMPRPEEILFPTQKERVEERRKERQQRKLSDEFFDHATLLAVGRLVNRGLLQALDYPVSTGKEGGVFRATAADGFRAVKIYRIGNAVFRRLPPYIVEWVRREVGAVGNYAKMVFAWTRREHTILSQLSAAAVRAPRPFGYLRNVLVMEFIGQDGLAAPRLVNAAIEHPEALYDDLVDQLRRMVIQARLVHGDLSPYNVLLLEERPVLIDVAQSISIDHPEARTLLERDATNFARYFQKLGVDTSPERFFEAAGGPDLPVPETRGE